MIDALLMTLALAPVAAAPETATPETAAPETAAPETAAPEAVAPEAVAPDTGAIEPVADPSVVDAAGTADVEAADTLAEQPSDAAAPEEEAAEADPAAQGPVLHRAVEKPGPPYATEADSQALRARYGVPEQGEVTRKPVRWRCLIADPSCATVVEVQALSAYAMRFRQGDVSQKNVRKWSTGRAQYDVWLSLPVLVEHQKRVKFTKMSLGPKGGVIFSDTGDFWGNIGIAGRYWLGRGRWAPSIEFTSALAFKLGGRPTKNLGGADPTWQTQRGPVGFAADVGVGLGGFGSIVIGGQYDSPLAREDVPEQFRVSAAGMFYLGFRGNIAWGAPAGAAILTHGLTQRLAKQPNR